MIVVDASVAVDLLLRRTADPLEQILFAAKSLHAPHLLDVEVAHVLRRYAIGNEIAGVRAGQALDDLGELPITRHGHEALLPSIWRLRKNLTAYDATYVALAEALDATLLTRDRKLAASRGHQAKIRFA